MNIDNKKFTLGIEEEYMICNPKNGDLVNKASFIMDYFKDCDRYTFELLESEIEANSSVHYEINEAIIELSNLRNNLFELPLVKFFIFCCFPVT